jgi:hypothetical protein
MSIDGDKKITDCSQIRMRIRGGEAIRSKLYIGDELNAVVKVSGISGSVPSDLPDVTFHKTAAADYYALIGSGGPTIYVLGNLGNILLSRADDLCPR